MHTPSHSNEAADHLRGKGARLGHIIAVTGSSGSIALDLGPDGAIPARESCPAVGELVKVIAGDGLILGLVSKVETSERVAADGRGGSFAQIEFVGEINNRPGEDGLRFRRGIANYPKLGDLAYDLDTDEVIAAYVNDLPVSASIGTLVPQTSAQACVNIANIASRHFAVLGSTGTGKTCAVSIILAKIVERTEEARVFIIDPHDEYRHCFENRVEVINPHNIILPFWLFNFEEIIDVFFKARPGVESEVEILRDLIPAAKRLYARNNRAEGADAVVSNRTEAAFSVDTPVPYRLSDLIKMIDNRMGSLEQRDTVPAYKRLRARIESVSLDPRYGFMFSQRTVEDTMADVLSRLFRIPTNGKPITVVELAGFPSEVVDALVSVLCRLAFDFNVWSNGAVPIVVVCEEAHRYVPASKALGFGPTRRAVSRLAKEGRKYRLSLCLVTQRPSELDPTILSQCTTVFAMRLGNEADQAIIRAAVMESASGMLACLPSIGEREAIAFGDAVSLPMRMRFAAVAREALPCRMSQRRAAMIEKSGRDSDLVDAVVATWRAASTRYSFEPEAAPAADAPAPDKPNPSRPFFDQYADVPPAAAVAPAAKEAAPAAGERRRELAVDWKALRERARASG